MSSSATPASSESAQGAGVPPRLPALGERVLAFHPVTRTWRPATVLAVSPPATVRINFMFFAHAEYLSEFLASDHEVRWPEEVEPLDPAGDFMVGADEGPRARTWRAMLYSLTLKDPRIYGERRAAQNLSGAVEPGDLYPLLIAAMLDSDGRIPGGAALFVRMQRLCGGFDPRRMAELSEAEIEAVRRVMPSPLRARVLFTNARKFLELDEQPGGFVGWLERQSDPVVSLCRAFNRLEPRAAVLFLRTLGSEAIAPDDALKRVALRLGWIRPGGSAAEVGAVYGELARQVEDRPSLLDLTVRRFADAICSPEPRCLLCAVPSCPSRKEEASISLP